MTRRLLYSRAMLSDQVDPAKLTYRDHGAERYRGAVRNNLPALLDALEPLPRDAAGTRIGRIAQLHPLLAANGAIGSIAAEVLGRNSRPVRAILFDKTPKTNWSLGWHQDRTICVRAKFITNGFGPWSIKAGMHHVTPPIDLLARMVTLRIHLDNVPASNAPLLIAPGSHAHGRISIHQVPEIVRRCGTRACLARAGDVWLYATPILHASEAASVPGRRRVLQVDFAAEELPGGLKWLGF